MRGFVFWFTCRLPAMLAHSKLGALGDSSGNVEIWLLR
jgi:hypothetical protein